MSLTRDERERVVLAAWAVLSLFGRRPERRLVELLVGTLGYQLAEGGPRP